VIFRYAALTLLTTWLLWQFPFASTDTLDLPEITGYAAYGDVKAGDEQPATVFYRREATGQYAVYGLNGTGQLVRSLRLPGQQIRKADESTINLANKEGYITGPENGAFYIWYPQLGTQVFVFNEQGSFLWEKEESHYLHVFPRGRYIMAAAGDHSRMLFMNPDFKVHADFQGVLFTRYIVDDNPDLATGQVCLGSLDGEVIVAQLDRRIYLRQKIGYALKAMQCDFEKGVMAVIVEITEEVDKKPVQKDYLLRLKFSLGSAGDALPTEAMRAISTELKTAATHALPLRTVTASPMVITEETTCFLQLATGNEAGLAIYTTRGSKGAPRELAIPGAAPAAPPDTWKAARINLGRETGCLFTHKSGRVVMANDRGILYERGDLRVERVQVNDKITFLQTDKGIFTLK